MYNSFRKITGGVFMLFGLYLLVPLFQNLKHYLINLFVLCEPSMVAIPFGNTGGFSLEKLSTCQISYISLANLVGLFLLPAIYGLLVVLVNKSKDDYPSTLTRFGISISFLSVIMFIINKLTIGSVWALAQQPHVFPLLYSLGVVLLLIGMILLFVSVYNKTSWWVAALTGLFTLGLLVFSIYTTVQYLFPSMVY